MRIAVFIKSTTFHRGYGGLETQNKSLCEGLALRGHDLLVFSPQQELKFETKYENGVKYHFIPSIYRLSRFNKSNWHFKSQDVFRAFHNEAPFDLVLSQSSAGVGVMSLKKELGFGVVSVAHGTIMGELKTRVQSSSGIKDLARLGRDIFFVLRVFFGRQRRFVHGSDKIIAVSEAVKKALIEETFVSSDKVAVVNNGINPEKIEKAVPADLQMPLESRNFLYVGQITRSKGLDTIVDMASAPEFARAVFHIVGDGPYLEALKRKTIENETEDHFVFYGKLDYEQVLSYFKSRMFAAFLFPTKRIEGFPMVLVESLFAGLPVVAYDMGGVSDAVISGKTGYLIEPGNFEDFKEKCALLLEEDSERGRISESAKAFAYENFTLEKMINGYEKVFREVKNNG